MNKPVYNNLYSKDGSELKTIFQKRSQSIGPNVDIKSPNDLFENKDRIRAVPKTGLAKPRGSNSVNPVQRQVNAATLQNLP